MKYFRILLLALIAFPVASEDYNVTVSSVHVWVKATKGGQPVSGLTQNDFEVYEDGVKVPINCFEEQVVAGTPAATAPESSKVQAVSKKFVLYLDLYNTSSRELNSIRPHLNSFIDSISNGGHEVMLAALMPNGKLGVISPFTKDLNRIRILVNKAPAGADRSIAIRKNMDELNRAMADEGGGGKGSVALVDRVRDGFQLARTYARQDQDLSEFTLSAVGDFAEYLAKQSLGEDPVVVYVSGGFSVDPGRQYYDIVSGLASAAQTPEEYAELSKVQESNMDMRNQIKKTFGKLNKMNVTFYTIDTGGLGGQSEYQDSLVEMANETGGVSFYNSQNFQLGFSQVVTDLNQQYLLCFSAPAHKKPGEYHNIQVKTSKPGVDLRYRKGYVD